MPSVNGPDLPESVLFDPAADFANFLQSVPAKWVVYLMSDAQGHPFQLLGVKNLRASLANRLAEQPAEERTRSIPYRQVVRKVSWVRVDSQAEADWLYAQLARELFASTYRKMIESWSAWYIEIDPEAAFPRYTVTESPRWELSRTTFGPLPTKAQAQKLVETIEDAFDLCRYHHILIQAPRGQACAYKQMHKCPAPCDGSISVGQYHLQLQYSIAAIGNPLLIAQQEQRMQAAAAALQFEAAGKIKAHIAQLRTLSLRSIAQLRFVAVLRGARAKTYRLMLLTPEVIEMTPQWSDKTEVAGHMNRFQNDLESIRRWDDLSHDRLSFIARQLMLKSSDTVITAGDPSDIDAACATLARRKAEPPTQDEGVVQESA